MGLLFQKNVYHPLQFAICHKYRWFMSPAQALIHPQYGHFEDSHRRRDCACRQHKKPSQYYPPIIMVPWKITLTERKRYWRYIHVPLNHDFGRKGRVPKMNFSTPSRITIHPPKLSGIIRWISEVGSFLVCLQKLCKLLQSLKYPLQKWTCPQKRYHFKKTFHLPTINLQGIC